MSRNVGIAVRGKEGVFRVVAVVVDGRRYRKLLDEQVAATDIHFAGVAAVEMLIARRQAATTNDTVHLIQESVVKCCASGAIAVRLAAAHLSLKHCPKKSPTPGVATALRLLEEAVP